MVDVIMEQLKDYNSPIYDEQRIIIEKYRAREYSWEEIKYGRGKTEEDLNKFIEDERDLNDWNITPEDWKELVELERLGEVKRLSFSNAEKHSIIDNGNEDNDLVIPLSETSCWQKYKQYLLKDKGFKRDDVEAIENSSFRILKRLDSDTNKDPVKGLVVGNVQSGKTANMAALMAMAADYGWNMFIVLSGTIENLRIQTLERLISDLHRPGCNLAWQGISRPSKKCQPEEQAQNLLFERQSNMRYLTVSLKNSTRLKNLLQWLHADRKSAELMKIMVIDDESDQAGINTKKEDSDERTRINQLIINLVENKDDQGNETDDCFKAMNYIGYTATPYANVLNEASKESLYPRNFISTLQVSKTYFGPQQIFGDRENNTYNGLDIVRRISDEDIIRIKNIHNGENHSIPNSFERAICWFLCCVAAERYRGVRKPFSMLVHTSQMQKHHEAIRKAVEKWFNNSNDYIISECKDVWEEESLNFTRDSLRDNYPDFAEPIESISNNPSFKEIEPFLLDMLKVGLTNIMLGGEGEFRYSKGIHLCVDDAKNQGITPEGIHMRIIYPKDSSKLAFAPAFIVIGGATLSRGLTIEGLVSTYFLRSTRLGDTLMQMGRWFGYRRGYELLPRIWITDNCINQFEFLSDMDSDLRARIAQMEKLNQTPKQYAVIIKQSPSTKLLRISSKNKMKGAIPTDMNYSGMHIQTDKFIDDKAVLEKNNTIVTSFIENLGIAQRGDGALSNNCYIWRDIKFDSIYEELLSKFTFHEKLLSFSNRDSIKEWVDRVTEEKKLQDWNVILFSLEQGEQIDFAGYKINKVHRTRRFDQKDTINIGVLTDPKEKIADVQYSLLSRDGKNQYDSYTTDKVQAIRADADLETTPNLVIYVIDKDSKVSRGSTSRKDLNAPCDITGISINIPGDRVNEGYASSVMIDLAKYGLGADIDGEDEYEH